MENPRKHDKKNTTRIFPLNIVAGAGAGAGAGRFGVGGVVLFGGVLVTATVVSALAFRRRSQRRSSPENVKNTPAPAPVTEIKSDDGPNKLEVMMKSDEDSSVECLPLEVQNLSSDEVVSMKEIKSEKIQSLTLDENHNCEEMMDLNVGENQENTLIRVDSAFESEEFGSSCEKIDLHSEEHAVMEARIEEDSCLERDDDGGGEEQKHLKLIDDGTDAHVDANSLVCNKSIEEHGDVEVFVKDTVLEALENKDEEDEDHQETIFMNEEAEQDEVKDNLQMQVLEEIEMNDDDEGDYADQIGHEVVMEEEKAIDAASLLENEVTVEEEVIKEACGNLVNKEDVFKTTDHEVAPDGEEMHQVYETFVVECVMKILNEAVDDQTTAKEAAPLKSKETAQMVEEHAIIEDEMMHDELINVAKVDDQTDNSPLQLMITEDELINKEEIPHVESVKEDANGEEDVIKEVIKMADHEVAPEIHQVCETFMAAGVMNRLKEAVDDQTTAKEDAPSSRLMNAEERDKETAQKVVEQASIEDELFNEDEKCNVDKMILEQLIEAAIVDKQTGYKLVKKDEIQDVQSVKEVEIEDSYMHEELTAEAKISDHKIEENMEENNILTVLRKNQNDSNDNGNIKEDEGSKSTLTEEEKRAFAVGDPWDLKLMALSVLMSVWCICHWYSELPFPELSLVGSLFFIMIILGYRNHARYLVKHECK